MKRILIMMMALCCLGFVSVLPAGAHDGTTCEKKSRGETVISMNDKDSCRVYWYWDGDLHCLENLDGLESLKALEGLEGLKGLKELERLDGCEGLDDLGQTLDELYDDLEAIDGHDSDLDLEELDESLEDLYLHLPPPWSLNVPLPPAAPIHAHRFSWDWDDEDIGADHDEMSEEEQLRLEALSALERLDGDETLPMLEKIVREDIRPAIRSRALTILRRIDDDRVLSVLGDVARNDPDVRVRKKAIRYLGESGDKKALGILKEILEQ